MFFFTGVILHQMQCWKNRVPWFWKRCAPVLLHSLNQFCVFVTLFVSVVVTEVRKRHQFRIGVRNWWTAINFTVLCNVVEVDCIRIYLHQSSWAEIKFARMVRNWILKITLVNAVCHLSLLSAFVLTILDLGVRTEYLDQSEILGVTQNSTRKSLSQNPILKKSLTG